MDAALRPRPVYGSLDELLAGADERVPFLTSDSKSGSAFERVRIDGEWHILKHIHVDSDWTMRFNGDVGCHPAQVWAAGLMDTIPERIDHGVVGVAAGIGRNGWGAAILMRDLADGLVPEGEERLDLDRHLGYLDDLAALSARMWGWTDDVGLVPLASRWSWFGAASLAIEESRGWRDPVPRIAMDGWRNFEVRVPREVVTLIEALRRDLDPLVGAVRSTPSTFLHGDWKLGNVGTAGDGRTILIDWTYPGEGPACFDLAWYLAINQARLPQSKEDAIAAFRTSIEGHGIETEGWYERQVGLCLLGALVIFGWEKAFGEEAELRWWCDRAIEGARFL